MALIRLTTVSVPVDAYVVVLVPSLTVILPFAGIPSTNSEVFAESGSVPVPVAGEPAELELEEEVPEPPVEACSALCNAALNCALTRSSAVLFAMLARPFTSLVMRPPIAVISASRDAEV